MTRHIVDISLADDEEKLIKYLAKKDGITVKEELRNLLNLQIWEEQQLSGRNGGRVNNGK